MKTWVNVHNHTTNSLLDGHGSIDRYGHRAKELGMPALGILDHGNLFGWLDHYDLCKKLGLKPILGIEAYQARKTRFDRDPEERAGPSRDEWDQRGPYHLGLIAQNKVGYHNVMKLSSRAFLEGYYVKPRLDYDLIAEHAEGIIVLSGCLGGAVQQALLRDDYESAFMHAAKMQEIVGRDNYFIEVQNHGLPEQARVLEGTLNIAKVLGAKVIATGDCHYVNKEDSHNHDIMLCNGTKSFIHEENRFKFKPEEFYLHSYDEMLPKFEPEWLKTTLDLADMVDVQLEFNEFHFPHFPDVPPEKTPTELFEEQVWEGMADRYGEITPELRERCEYELGVVKRMGFVEYFLVVGDLVRWAKQEGIRVGFGRGSAAGSILSYALKITALDPIKYNLLFERFLIEGRKSMPDIDIDIDSRYRDKLIEYARQKYGNDRVAQIVTFAVIGARNAVRDAARVLGLDFAKGDMIAKLMPPAVLGVTKSLDESLEIVPELRELYEKDEEVRQIFDAARGLEGLKRSTGIHAAGVVITPGPISDYVPVMWKGDGTPIVTQWDMHRVDEVGLLKIDFLGLRNIDVVDMAFENIKERFDLDIDWEEIDLEDQDVYSELARGDTMGVFQIESGGMQEMTVAVRPDSIEDLMAIQSLYRPGPMGSGMDKMYVNRKHGREEVSVPHPSLKDVLEPSYGVMLYQEDVLNATRTITGWGAGDADDLRKVIGKKLMDKVGSYREKFVRDAKANKIDERISNKVFSDIEFFAGYGFGKAHAASYSLLCYITAWLRHHYPAEYMAALLTSTANKKDKLTPYLNYCNHIGIDVLPPSVDESEFDFTVTDDGEIVFGLSAIEGMGDKTIVPLLNTRPEGGFSNLYNFFRHADNAVLNKAVFEHLLRAGALDELVEVDVTPVQDRDELLAILDEERKEIGVYVTEHPLSGVWDYLAPSVTHTIADLQNYNDNEPVRLGGMLTGVEKRFTKANKLMYTLTFEDLTGSIKVMIFPQAAAKADVSNLVVGNIGTLVGRVMREENREDSDSILVKLVYSGFDKLPDQALGRTPPILLKTKTRLTPHQLGKLSAIVESRGGTSHVFLEMREGDHLVTFKFKKATDYEIKSTLEQIITLNEATNEYT